MTFAQALGNAIGDAEQGDSTSYLPKWIKGCPDQSVLALVLATGKVSLPCFSIAVMASSRGN